MSLTADKVEEMLTNFVVENNELLEKSAKDDPQNYDIVMEALNIISSKFGKGQVSAPKVDEEPVKDVSPMIEPPVVQPEPLVTETISVGGEELTEDELKEAIRDLKPLAELDDDIKAELESLKNRLKSLKSIKKNKKS